MNDRMINSLSRSQASEEAGESRLEQRAKTRPWASSWRHGTSAATCCRARSPSPRSPDRVADRARPRGARPGGERDAILQLQGGDGGLGREAVRRRRLRRRHPDPLGRSRAARRAGSIRRSRRRRRRRSSSAITMTTSAISRSTAPAAAYSSSRPLAFRINAERNAERQANNR